MIDPSSLEQKSMLNSLSKFAENNQRQVTSLGFLDDSPVSTKDINELQNWNFNILTHENLSDKFRFIFTMFQSLNFFEPFGVDGKIFGRFINVLQSEYDKRNNPFHNFDHGITVCHGAYYLMKNRTMAEVFSPCEKFAFLFSALCHDVDHTGRNNAFECASFSELAILYNDESVLENHHASCTFQILRKDDYNILANMCESDLKEFRKTFISNILATDMKKHFELLKAFELKATDFINDEECSLSYLNKANPLKIGN